MERSPSCHFESFNRHPEEKCREDMSKTSARKKQSIAEFFEEEKKFLLPLLLNIVSKELITLTREKRFIGAAPAVLSVLHTWNGRLGFHPHVHLLISGGGVSDDGLNWREANASFLVPVKRLSKQIAKSLRKAIEKQRPELLDEIPKRAWKASWCSFCVPYGRGEKAVLNYLSRYVFRMAITNHRIIDVTETEVTFRYKDRKTNTMQTETVTGVEFLRRFLIHVLPKGFHKVRYYGLWHPSKRALQMAARVLLIFRKPTGKEMPLLTSEIILPDITTEMLSGRTGTPDGKPCGSVKRYGECCPKCGSDRVQMIAESKRIPIPYEHVRLGMFDWLEAMTRGQPQCSG